MRAQLAAVLMTLSACAPRLVDVSDAGDAGDVAVGADAGPTVDAGVAPDAGPTAPDPCLSCAHGTWCLRATCVAECAPCETDADCVDGGTCDRWSCVFLAPGCSGPAMESVRISVLGPWSNPDLYELDVPSGRLAATLERESADGGLAPRDGGVVFIDAGAWPAAPAWCPQLEVVAEACGFDMASLELEVSGGGQAHRFSYYTGASHLPAVHPLVMDLFRQFFRADAGR